jgi:predicted hydrocarbon binding protein
MGIAHELRGVSTEAFLGAFERSAYRHVQASFDEYQSRQPLKGSEFISSVLEIASHLGWGVWTSTRGRNGSLIVEVLNSPFAAGFGPSERPVCAAIVGILRAVALVAHGGDSLVVELACAAQGAPTCRFEMPTPAR